MAKKKGEKVKSKRRKDGGRASGPAGAGGSVPSFWSAADECAHYAALGCHIANIARCAPSSTSASRHRTKGGAASPLSYTCSEYEEMYDLAMQQCPWLLGIERFDASDYHPEDLQSIPEVAMNDGDDDDERMTLTLTNVTNTTNICYVSVFDVDVCGARGDVLTSGTASAATSSSADEDEEKATIATREQRKCTTFIVLCPPQTFVHLCYMAPGQVQPSSAKEVPITSWTQVEIETDIQPWSFHNHPDDEHALLLHFPFQRGGEEASGDTDAARVYQCTQSENGQLTHFFHGNYHAVDFACPVGTPLYSPASGVVVDVHDRTNVAEKPKGGSSNNDRNELVEVSGIAARNLFHWNSIMIRVDEGEKLKSADATKTTTCTSRDPLYIEFVHIQTNSCVVKVGDAVKKGQLLCRSGSVGFSPEPHLHLAAYRSNEDDAATVRVRFERATSHCVDAAAHSFMPVAGGWYDQSGLCEVVDQ